MGAPPSVALPTAESALPAGGAGPGRLHEKPGLIPIYSLLCFVGALVCILYGAQTFPVIERKVLSLAAYPGELRSFAGFVAAATMVLAIVENIRRFRPPPVPGYLRVNRALGYGIFGALAFGALVVSKHPEVLRAILFDTQTEAIGVAIAAGFSVLAYVGWLHPLHNEVNDKPPSYQTVVEQLQNTYDFVLGIERVDDYKKALKGAAQWLILPASSLWTNLLCFGGIGSGKTTTVAYPLIIQALGKFPDDPVQRPSLIFMDLKGNNALRIYELCKSFGREKEFWCVSPGNQLFDDKGEKPLLNAKGAPIIPVDRFLKWNPIGGAAAGDLRSSALLDAISATNDAATGGGAHEYFENIEGEFLSMTVQLFDALAPVLGEVNLFDIWQFANDREKRLKFVGNSAVKGSPMELYFKTFAGLKDEDQDKRISGLKAKLSKLASKTVQSTFCPQAGDAGLLPGFTELVMNKPGIVVFSVPSALYTKPLTRILGIMFMRAFHAEAERRSSDQFRLAGGNHQRLILQVTDECHAFMNKGVPDFTAVSREARTCSVFLTQSLEQISDQYRSKVIGNFRSKILLSVNDPLTLKEFSNLFGEVKELTTSVSTSESLNDVQHGVFTQTVGGKQQGMSSSTSVSERTVKRFTEGDIQHLPKRRAIVHLFDGDETQEAKAFEVTPFFRLAYHLLSPLEHSSVACPKGGKRARHAFAPFSTTALGSRAAHTGLRCEVCGFELTGETLDDRRAYAEAFPHLLAPLP